MSKNLTLLEFRLRSCFSRACLLWCNLYITYNRSFHLCTLVTVLVVNNGSMGQIAQKDDRFRPEALSHVLHAKPFWDLSRATITSSVNHA